MVMVMDCDLGAPEPEQLLHCRWRKEHVTFECESVAAAVAAADYDAADDDADPLWAKATALQWETHPHVQQTRATGRPQPMRTWV